KSRWAEVWERRCRWGAADGRGGRGVHAIRTMLRDASSCRVSASAGGVTYARRLGIFSATMAVIGGIIGSGVFLGPEVVAARVGSAGLTLAAWVLGGLIALAGAFCFGELGARRPRAGGGYVYLREAFGPLPAVLYGWAVLFVLGLWLSPPTALHRPSPPSTAPDGMWGVTVALGAALIPVLFAYGGWQQTNFIAEEIIEPERSLPRALVLGVAGVVTVYLLAN